jgi:hypothetical protein
MSIYDISAESNFKVFNYILIILGNMLVNVTKFIIKIYNSVELFILDNSIQYRVDNEYLTHPITMVFLTLSIILLCNLINKKFNEIKYISNYDLSSNTCGEMNVDKNEQNIYENKETYHKNTTNNCVDNVDNEDNEEIEDNEEFDNNEEYLTKYNIIKKNTELMESIDETSNYLKQYVTTNELNNFIRNNIENYRNFVIENVRLTDLEIEDLSYVINDKLTDREFRYLVRKINQIFERKIK